MLSSSVTIARLFKSVHLRIQVGLGQVAEVDMNECGQSTRTDTGSGTGQDSPVCCPLPLPLLLLLNLLRLLHDGRQILGPVRKSTLVCKRAWLATARRKL